MKQPHSLTLADINLNTANENKAILAYFYELLCHTKNLVLWKLVKNH